MFATGFTLQDRYTIIRLLGIGGMASVYEATDRRLRINVALKHLHVGDVRRHTAFEREAQLLAALRHPALPTVYDYFIEGDDAFLVMQLVDGADLAAQLAGRNTPFPVGQVLRWADELLDALAYLHQQSPPVIHRDIKPQNLKLRPDGGIVLLDFGLAKGAIGATNSVARSIFGYTLHYAPLEQIRGEGTDARSDLFALAMTSYELLTKRRPPDALERIAALSRGGDDPLQLAHLVGPSIPAMLGECLYAALALEPAQRPTSAALLRQRLHDARAFVAPAADAVLPPPNVIPDAVDSSPSWQATMQPALPLPTGTVTFVLASVRLPDAKDVSSTNNDQQQFAARIRAGLERSGGAIFHDDGTTVGAAYGAATDGLAGAILLARRELGFVPQGQTLGGVQITLHCGVAEERDGRYVGPPVDRALRMLEVCQSGQILFSRAVYELVSDHLAPGVALRELGSYRLRGMLRPEAIFQVVAPGLPADFPPLMPGGRPSANLPHQSTALIGREREVAAVGALARHAAGRLVTLIGPGGIGKTRLAVEVASELAADYADGAAFVGLASVDSAALVLAAVGQALGVREQIGGSIRDAVTAFLREKQFLLLLDNCEHVLASAPEIHALLDACPRLQIIATSRQRLGIVAEEVVPVPPLGLPAEQHASEGDEWLAALGDSGAVALFVERARTVQPNFVLSDSNGATVAAICRRLDGLPLAIELAAARARLFTPEALLARLEGAYQDTPLRLLTGGKANQPARQRTLREAISWSYDLLDAAEQALFRQLSLFAGGCTLEAIEAVAQLPNTEDQSHLDLLISLLDKSLLRKEQQPDGEPRFVLLETIRAYARDRLVRSSEAKDGQARHAAYYLTLAETAEPHLRSHEQLDWLARLDREYANMRAVLQWALTTDSVTALRLAVALSLFWVKRRQTREAYEWLSKGLVIASVASPALRAKALGFMGDMRFHQSDLNGARACYQESLEIYRELDDQTNIAWALHNLGRIERHYPEAHRQFIASLALFRSLHDSAGCAAVLNELGNIERWQGSYDIAQQYHKESIILYDEVGDIAGKGMALVLLGHIATTLGSYLDARRYISEGLALFRELGDQGDIAYALQVLGVTASHQGDFATARLMLAESLVLFRKAADWASVAWSLYDLGRIAVREGNGVVALELLAESLDAFQQQGETWGIAWVLTMMGYAAHRINDTTAACTYFRRSLAAHEAAGTQEGIIYTLEGYAALLIADRQDHYGAQILSSAAAARSTLKTPLPPSDRPAHDTLLGMARDHLDAIAFATAWDIGATLTLAQTCARIHESEHQ